MLCLFVFFLKPEFRFSGDISKLYWTVVSPYSFFFHICYESIKVIWQVDNAPVSIQYDIILPNLYITPLQLWFSFLKKNLAFIFWPKGRKRSLDNATTEKGGPFLLNCQGLGPKGQFQLPKSGGLAPLVQSYCRRELSTV